MRLSPAVALVAPSVLAAALVAGGGGFGCAGRAELLPNSDKNLRRTAAEFAADAAKRFPYKADAPRGGDLAGRSQVGYSLNVLEVINLSENDWTDVEVWVNKTHVVSLPLMERNKLKRIPFQAIYDSNGANFPTNNKTVRVQTVEVFMGGKMYDVRTQLAD